MSLPEVVSREEWLAARRDLLVREKQSTRERDALNADRRRLPMVRIDKEYVFEGETGKASLPDLFEDNRQLIIYHAMFDPSWEKACPGCTATMDESTDGLLAHLKTRDTAYVRVSRAPYGKIAAFRAERGWTFPWYSSYGSDFNYDFHVTLDAAVTPIEYNYRSQAELVAIDPDWAAERSTEMPGFSCFLRDGDAIFHTYSTYARGTEVANDSYALLDLTALGRQEDWEEPAGRAENARKADPTFS
ncbi:DUF899 domain-containing protein [Actinopolymorpha sp. B11F2]|uniref:DUF899 domain-containing protein n=1 Tax=Actinopolymorpha sp. B11F2 TaxID=3160862 RepID=UPI0032E4C7DF